MKKKVDFEDLIKKVINIRLSYKSINILLAIGLIVLLLPMSLIALYDVPSSDDFGHCIWTYPVYEQTGSIIQTIMTAFKWVGNCFKTISGTFTVQLLDSLAPNVFGIGFYRVTFFIMITSIIISLVYLYKTVFADYFNVEKSYITTLYLITLIIFTQCLPSSAEGFYWYVGAITYTFYFAVFLIMFSLAFKLFSGKYKTRYIIILPLLSFILGGGNHITALMTGVIIAGCIVLSLLFKKKALHFIPSLITWIAAFTINVIAPGNEIRKQMTGGGAGFIKSFVLSFRAIILSIDDWCSLPFIAFVLVTIPVLWVALSKVEFNFKYPAVISFFSFCFLAAMYYPPLYGMNSTGQGRLKNIVFFSFTILLIVNIFYWLGWIKSKINTSYFTNCKNGLSVVYIIILICCVGFGTFATVLTPVTSYSAVKSLLNGEAKDYYQTELERIERIENSTEKDIVLPAFKSKPYTIFFYDITADAEDGQNIAMANYYQKDSIIVSEELK